MCATHIRDTKEVRRLADPVYNKIPTIAKAAFARDIYDRLKGEAGNLFFSPHSISTALGMTFAGARGDTASQMFILHWFSSPRSSKQNIVDDGPRKVGGKQSHLPGRRCSRETPEYRLRPV